MRQIQQVILLLGFFVRGYKCELITPHLRFSPGGTLADTAVRRWGGGGGGGGGDTVTLLLGVFVLENECELMACAH